MMLSHTVKELAFERSLVWLQNSFIAISYESTSKLSLQPLIEPLLQVKIPVIAATSWTNEAMKLIV